MPDILSYVQEQLKSDTRLCLSSEERKIDLTLLGSHSRRSHSLFPWAQNHKDNKIWVQDVLLSVAESSNGSDYVPTFGLEAAIFKNPSTGISLLYISKADTTGLFARPSLAKRVSAAFIAWFLLCGGNDLRVHVFGRAAPQYLYPGSIDNATKNVLSDKRLSGWWKSVLTLAASLAKDTGEIKAWFSLAGQEEDDARRMIGSSKLSESGGLPWTYGHAYSTLPPICSLPEGKQPSIGDLVPAFPDDPKSRFLTSLTSSPMSSAGEPGDYEDAHLSSHHNDNKLEEQRQTEKTRLQAVEGGIEEFWERLAWRQECCSGAVVGFFVLSLQRKDQEHKPQEETPSLAHAVYTKLWSAYHNVNYNVKQSTQDPLPPTTSESVNDNETTAGQSSVSGDANAGLARIADSYKTWKSQLRAALVLEVGSEEVYSKATPTNVSLQLAKASGEAGEKRKADQVAPEPAKPQVMQLKPKKKVKPNPT